MNNQNGNDFEKNKSELLKKFKSLLIQASVNFENQKSKSFFENVNDDYMILIALSNAVYDLETRLKKIDKLEQVFKG